MGKTRESSPAHSADSAQNASGPGFFARHQLKAVLVLGDSTALLLGYALTLTVTGYFSTHPARFSATTLVAVVGIGLWSVRSQGLFLGRISAVRVMEITRSARAVAIMGALMLLVDRLLKLDLRVKSLVLASLVTFVFFVISRSSYRAWLASARVRGRYRRRVLIIGTDLEARRMVDLFATHPELGIQVVGAVGPRPSAGRNGLLDLWLGGADEAEAIVDASGVSGIVVSPQGVSGARLNALVRNLHPKGIYVHIGTGISGIDSRRLRPMSVAHEPMFYVEFPSLARTQLFVKRVFDLVVASLIIIVASPVLIIVAIAIKLNDRGPVFFRQQRVGLDGQHFGLMKFRTMVVDAEQQLHALQAANERHGPLFKMTHDPRVTRVGRYLRESSLDELPQLFNVLRGEMSLVGPRPALPSEVTNFQPELRARESVMPGISGLWQVEARDNPSFEAYRRLDLFYVENWSVTLDLLILVATLEQFIVRLVRVVRRSKPAADEVVPAVGAVSAVAHEVQEPVRPHAAAGLAQASSDRDRRSRPSLRRHRAAVSTTATTPD